MKSFKVGDRVCWKGNKANQGTVETTNDTQFRVRWNDYLISTIRYSNAQIGGYVTLVPNGLDRVLDEL